MEKKMENFSYGNSRRGEFLRVDGELAVLEDWDDDGNFQVSFPRSGDWVWLEETEVGFCNEGGCLVDVEFQA
jgi:hypothetical protein